MLITAAIYWPKVWALSSWIVLSCLVLRPMPAHFMTWATLALQLRQVGPRFSWAPFDPRGQPSDPQPRHTKGNVFQRAGIR